jgi:hypothetical protein
VQVDESYFSREAKSTKMTTELLKSSKTLHFPVFRPYFLRHFLVKEKAKKTTSVFHACAAF